MRLLRIAFESWQSKEVFINLLNNNRRFHFISYNKKQVEYSIQPAKRVICQYSDHPSKALKQMEALCPPKPNVLLIAALMGFAIALFGT